MTSGALVGFLLLAVLLPLALSEAGELAPWLAAWLLQWGARRIGSPTATERYSEEWAANLEQVPGKLTKLTWACGVVLWSVPTLHWRAHGHALDLKYAYQISGRSLVILVSRRRLSTALGLALLLAAALSSPSLPSVPMPIGPIDAPVFTDHLPDPRVVPVFTPYSPVEQPSSDK